MEKDKMRIITGDFRGRRLETPENYNIRPTSDKVKEAMFSIISAHIDESICVDLFCGTGNLGLEALSRGAEKCYFGDNSRTSIEITKRNIAMCKAEEWATVIPGDFEKVLYRISEKEDKVDIFFLDPPYKEGLYDKCFELISELNLLNEDGIIVAEHNVKDVFPDELYGFVKIKERSYGSIAITIYG